MICWGCKGNKRERERVNLFKKNFSFTQEWNLHIRPNPRRFLMSECTQMLCSLKENDPEEGLRDDK